MGGEHRKLGHVELLVWSKPCIGLLFSDSVVVDIVDGAHFLHGFESTDQWHFKVKNQDCYFFSSLSLLGLDEEVLHVSFAVVNHFAAVVEKVGHFFQSEFLED